MLVLAVGVGTAEQKGQKAQVFSPSHLRRLTGGGVGLEFVTEFCDVPGFLTTCVSSCYHNDAHEPHHLKQSVSVDVTYRKLIEYNALEEDREYAQIPCGSTRGTLRRDWVKSLCSDRWLSEIQANAKAHLNRHSLGSLGFGLKKRRYIKPRNVRNNQLPK